MPWPRISLVTPSYNQGRFLPETIDSVLSQGYPNLEYFVFDGGSTDESVPVIKRYADRLSYWESKPDKGQTDAIAKGFARMTGDICNWLNSDDLLAPGALYHMADLYRRDPEAGIYAAAVENFTDGHLGCNHEKSVPCNFDLETLLHRSGRTVHRHQPGVFMDTKQLRRAGGVRPRFHFCMDLDVHARLLATGARVVYDDRTVAYFRRHPAAKTHGVSANTANAIAEHMAITEEIGKSIGLKPRHFAGQFRPLAATACYALRKQNWPLLQQTARLFYRALQ